MEESQTGGFQVLHGIDMGKKHGEDTSRLIRAVFIDKMRQLRVFMS